MTDIVLHIVDTGPKITAWAASTAYTVGDRVLTATGTRLYECIAAGTSTTAEPTAQLADTTDGTAHWHYLCTQDYASLKEWADDYGAVGGLTLTLATSLEKHLVWVWDKGSGYLGRADLNALTEQHTSLYHIEFSIPGQNNLPTDFVGTWDLANAGDSFVEQNNPGILSIDASKGALQSDSFALVWRQAYGFAERLQVQSAATGQVMRCVSRPAFYTRDFIVEATNSSRTTTIAAFDSLGPGVSNCVFIDHSTTAAYVFRWSKAGPVNCTLVKPSDVVCHPDTVLISGATNLALKNWAIYGFAAAVNNPFPDEPVAPSGWTWINLVTDIPTANFAAGTLTNCKTGEAALTATTPFVQAATTGTLDFNPVTGSASIDAGTTGGPSDDIFGTIRDANPDAGAVEYVASGQSGASSLSGAGTLAAKGVADAAGKASEAGAGTLAAKGTADAAGKASEAGAGTLAAKGTTDAAGKVSEAGAGAITARGTVTHSGSASLSGAGTLAASATPGGQPSQAYRSAIQARNNPDQLIALMVVEHPDLDPVDWPPDGKIRLTDAAADLLAGGDTYIAWPFRWRRPDQRADRLPQVPLAIDNVDPRIMQAILPLTEPPTVTISAVMESSPEIVEEGPMTFDLQRTKDNRTEITAMLGFEPMLWMKYGRAIFDPVRFPGLFR